jgi:hypothetical protein
VSRASDPDLLPASERGIKILGSAMHATTSK